MAIFGTFLHFLSHLFGQAANIFEKVFDETALIAKQALPLVQVASTLLNGIVLTDPTNQPKVLKTLASYAATAVTDVQAVQDWTTANQGAPAYNIALNFVTLLMQHTQGHANTALTDLHTGIQIALKALNIDPTVVAKVAA